MNWDRIEGNWKQLKGRVRERWGKLTDQDLTAIEGKREQGRQDPSALRNRQGGSRETAEELLRGDGSQALNGLDTFRQRLTLTAS